jgi:YD repeat-containing protein
MRYPSGKVVHYDVDNAGRELKVYTQTKLYADLSTVGSPYSPDGRIAKLKLGNNLWETRDYQAPGTPTSLRLGTYDGGSDRLELAYNYAATSNNGNLLSHIVRLGNVAWSQTYEYDMLNRLTCATERDRPGPAPSCSQENSWRQMFAYDRFGNRWVTQSSGFTFADVHEFSAEGSVDHSTNRLVGVTYDAAGNQTLFTPWLLSYDAENRATSATSPSNGNSWFTYDGDGKRIKKVTQAPSVQTTFYVYDVAGRLAAEYSSEELVFAEAPGSRTVYLFPDLLNTPRAVTADNGTILECPDYSPFGRLLQTSSRNLPCHANTSRVSNRFTARSGIRKQNWITSEHVTSAARRRWLSQIEPSPTPSIR